MCNDAIYSSVECVAKRRLAHNAPRCLDIGAGSGDLLRLLRENWPNLQAEACDYHVERFSLEGVNIVQLDLNIQSLPYPDGHFNLVTCSEVLEHVENYRAVLREIYRVLKPGGLMVVTTPNVLNMKSRVRYLVSGFASLFGPLPVKNQDRFATSGHITPIPYFYLAHALQDCDFRELALETDKLQGSSRVLNMLFAPLIWLGWKRFLRMERGRYHTLGKENEPYVLQHNSAVIKQGRTLVVSAFK
ncbi:MAG: class I SAM-dependent methyltransferase [Pseudomonadota bacterium]